MFVFDLIVKWLKIVATKLMILESKSIIINICVVKFDNYISRLLYLLNLYISGFIECYKFRLLMFK